MYKKGKRCQDMINKKLYIDIERQTCGQKMKTRQKTKK